MDQKDIELLLERYWNCETSEEEEDILRNYFSGEEVPEQWRELQSFFSWQSAQSSVRISFDFEGRVLNRLEEEFPLLLMKNRLRFYTFLRVAASVLIVLSAGLGIYTHQMEEKRIEQSYSETFSDPKLAMKEAQAALNKISVSLSKGSDAVQSLLISGTDSVEVSK